jgi:hypothetical protein
MPGPLHARETSSLPPIPQQENMEKQIYNGIALITGLQLASIPWVPDCFLPLKIRIVSYYKDVSQGPGAAVKAGS